MKVFISSTYEDLKEYRERAIEVVERYECLPVAMEHFMSQPQDAETVCDKEIQECDIFIGIYAHRYGFVPKFKFKSITQQEYELAKDLEKPCLCFIVEERFPWNPAFIEYKKRKKLDSFLKNVREQNIVSTFTTTSDFEIKLSTSLGKLMAKQKAAEEGKKEEPVPEVYIPFAPTPFIAHPYPLPQHFTGRAAEMAELSNWFYNEKQPVLVMEAIGGMGKTALTWVWMQNDIIEKTVELDGVFWWSFYEAPFETFLIQLACYLNVLKENDRQISVLSADLAQLQAALHNRKFLLVLDGLERVLRGYADMSAMYIQEKGFEGDKIAEAVWDRRQREPVHPLAARFLQHLASTGSQSRILITTRLFPTPLEELSGIKHIRLKGLSEVDTVWFLRSEGMKGTRAELEQAGKVYDFHPLMLKLLASSIKRSRTKDVQEAFRLNLIDQKDPHKILTKSFHLLSKEERQVVSGAAVFRGVFTFDYAKALFPKIEENRLWQLMLELRNLGFLFYDEKEERFDFHPIMRSFLYHILTNRTEVHTLAVQYFQAAPKVKKVVSLEDLAPVIELYHHLVKAGKFDEAYQLFDEKIADTAYYQLSAYNLIIELLKELFPEGEDELPHLDKVLHQACILDELANSYALSGQPLKAMPLWLRSTSLDDKEGNKEGAAICLVNSTGAAQIHIGRFSISTVHLRKSIGLCQEIKDELHEALGHREFGRVLAYQGCEQNNGIPNLSNRCGIWAISELTKAFELFEKHKEIKWLSRVSAYCSLSALLQSRMTAVLPGKEKQAADYILQAMEQALKSLQFAKIKDKDAKSDHPNPRDFVRAYWLLGEALIQCFFSPHHVRIKPFDIPFYDDYFQEQIEPVSLQKGNELTAVERCLNEALRRCRKVNLVEFEPDILLAHSRLEWAKGSLNERILKEAHEIAQRAGYRLVLADLHFFCGQVLVESKQPQKLLELSSTEHLQKTKEYALDVSEFSDLYQSEDPHFYDGIPEYEMLKRGMTEEERISNGYWIAYKIADVLEKKVGR